MEGYTTLEYSDQEIRRSNPYQPSTSNGYQCIIILHCGPYNGQSLESNVGKTF